MSADRLEAALARQMALHPRKIDLSLGRIERLLAALGHPERNLPPTFHIAGTNGKGSTQAFLRAILEAGGARVHAYTSPHLVRFNERIRLAGALVDDARLIDALERCERANAGGVITFFEITTAAAFLLFSETPADALILEVGLGGRVDATNVITAPAASIVTSVSLDHVEFLGADVAGIAAEKGAIFKRGAPAIIARQTSDDALRVLERCAARAGAPAFVAERDFFVRAEHGRLVYEDEAGLLDLPAPRLLGAHQYDNAAAAIAALRRAAWPLAASAFESGLSDARWPARMQALTRGALKDIAPAGADLWLDGGHNGDGARAIARALGELNARDPRPLALVCGMLATKDVATALGAFKNLAQEVIAVPVSGDHLGRGPADVASVALGLGMKAQEAGDLRAALALLGQRDWPTPPRILIWGSLYLAGEALAANGAPPA